MELEKLPISEILFMINLPKGRTALGQLAERMQLTRQYVRRLANSLIEKGLIDQTKEGRFVLLKPTADGARKVARYLKHHN